SVTATATTTATRTATMTAAPSMTSTPTATATALPGTITLVGTTNSTTAVLKAPAGIQNGDLMIAFYSYWTMANATAPAGWTQLHTSSQAGSGVEQVWYRYVSGDVAGQNYTWTFTGATAYEAGGIVAYHNAAPVSFEDGFCLNHGRSTAPSL